MAAIAKENLDERIERIKKRNEEIEKKYREAEEDRLMALKENAMVETKPPKDEDWPRSHKYDKIDFTYDVKPEKLEELNKTKKTEEPKQKRDYKKFAEGEGPPPDPVYNFLADAERDGTTAPHPAGKDGKATDKKDSRQNNSGKNNKDQQQKRGGPNSGSFRGRGGKAHSPKYQKQNSQPEYEQWRNEREKIDEARINRQKVGEGKWKREWDNEKINSENEALLRPERTTLGDAFHAAKKSPTHNNNKGQNHNQTDCLVEKRGNITVSVSQTGEVKSVKLTSAPVIGTGRVGPRQVGKPQFSIQSVEKDLTTVPISPQPQQKNFNKSNNNNNKPITRSQNNTISPVNVGKNNNNNNNNKRKTQSPKYVQPLPPVSQGAANVSPTPPIAPISGVVIPTIENSTSDIIAVDLSHKPEFAKKSVQERLLRARQTPTSNNTGSDLNASSDCNEVASNDDQKTNCDKTNESIQTAEPIAACN